MIRYAHSWSVLPVVLVLILGGCTTTASDTASAQAREEMFADYVWPPPPNEPRIRLVDIIGGRADVEGESGLRKVITGTGDKSPYDKLVKPFDVAFDSQGRLLVSDPALGAVIRFDRAGRKMDVFGTTGARTLGKPLGLDIGSDDVLFVADAARKVVFAFDTEGKIVSLIGRSGDLVNPTGVALSPDEKSVYVADSKAGKIVVFDRASGEVIRSIGRPGAGPGEFNHPTSLTFGPEGDLWVLDQLNARVQLLSPEGDFIDQLGKRGAGFGQFTRPKDVAVDDYGFIYVTDMAFSNFQIFDADFTLLTFIGEKGHGPGEFHGPAGICVRGDEFAVADQLGHRVKIFRFLVRD